MLLHLLIGKAKALAQRQLDFRQMRGDLEPKYVGSAHHDKALIIQVHEHAFPKGQTQSQSIGFLVGITKVGRQR